MNGVPEAVLLEPPGLPCAPAPRARGKARAAQPALPEPEDGAELLLLALAGMNAGDVELPSRADGGGVDLAPALPGESAARYTRVCQLERLGHVLGREELAVLLRARLAEQLLKAGSAAELAALLRVFDKIPERADRLASQAAADNSQNNQPDGFEITGLDLATSIAEARRLLAEIEAETGAVPGAPAAAANSRQAADVRLRHVSGLDGACQLQAAASTDDAEDGEDGDGDE